MFIITFDILVVTILKLTFCDQLGAFRENNLLNGNSLSVPSGSESVQNDYHSNVNANGLPTLSKFEIKAVLTKCPKPKNCDCENDFQCNTNETQTVKLRTKEYRTKCEEQSDRVLLRNCEKKISLTLKINNHGISNCNPQYIILDHVFDPTTNKKQRLLNPYVLKVFQKPVLQVYDLLFENVVNSGPEERVVNKNSEGFKGCSTDPLNPTCAPINYNNQQVPVNSGFCCPCPAPRNEGGSALSLNEKYVSSPDGKIAELDNQPGDMKDLDNANLMNPNIPSANGDLPLKITDLFYSPNYKSIDYGHDGFTETTGLLSNPNIVPTNLGSEMVRRSSDKGEKNQRAKRLHKRGGQDCNDRYTPPYADPQTYHDSAHCMEFSDVWYSVYKITHPNIEHSVRIQIFEKTGMSDGKINWKELTSSDLISVGTGSERYASSEGNILAYYSVRNEVDSEFAIDCKINKLLIPEVMARDAKEDDYPETRGGPPEYLVVQEKDLDVSGKTCNKAGVGYEAFTQQPRRCESDRNSCLQNQPKQMWQHDHDLDENGKKGCYFLKNYGLLPENPVRMKPCNASSRKTQNKVLSMYYLSYVTSTVNINFAADTNVVLRPNAFAIITEVYTETLNPKKVTVTAKILNSGLVTSIFYVAIGACPMEIPASFASIASQSVLIPPQSLHIYSLEIYCELPLENFFCSLEVFNQKHQLIAVRRIRFEKQDRCICVWYCKCVCYESDYSLKCHPLELEQYHAAGFQDGMPKASQVVNYSSFDDTVSIILHIILFCCLTLWYMGLIKAMLGCCFLPIGLWGLDKILDLPKKLNHYYEPELKEQPVEYDDDGWPIHPETGKKVNNIAPSTQFAINMVFFFIFPLAICWNLCKNLLGPRFSTEEMFSDLDICECKASQISLMKDYSLQNSANKISKETQSKQPSKNESKDEKSESQSKASDVIRGNTKKGKKSVAIQSSDKNM